MLKVLFSLCSSIDVEVDLEILFNLEILYEIQNLLWFYNC